MPRCAASSSEAVAVSADDDGDADHREIAEADERGLE